MDIKPSFFTAVCSSRVRVAVILKMKDISRPKGWGKGDMEIPEVKKSYHLHAGGIPYTIHDLVKGTFEIGKAKGVVYSDSLRGIMSDLIMKIENPKHKMRVSIEDGLHAVEIAHAAKEYAHKK